jgi:hypothetical protein
LEARQADGRPLRAHLEQVEARTGRRPPALDVEEIPAWGAHLFAAWLELHAGRGAGALGPAPLSWADLAAWDRLTGTGLQSIEARLILQIDRAWLEEKGKDKPATPAPSPGAPSPRVSRTPHARTR